MSLSVVPIVSGGMDSVTLAHLAGAHYHVPVVVSFDYGQRHSKELDFAEEAAKAIGARWACIDLEGLTPWLGGSSLTDMDIAVPDGHYAEESMKITVVPNRNMIMISIAAGIAVAAKAGAVAVGVHGGDHFIYPDCRPDFIIYMKQSIRFATEGFADWNAIGPVWAPFLNLTKADIVTQGVKFNVNYARTWSCYKGGEIHCGTCGTCVERKEAFRIANVVDPTEYEDAKFQVAAYRG